MILPFTDTKSKTVLGLLFQRTLNKITKKLPWMVAFFVFCLIIFIFSHGTSIPNQIKNCNLNLSWVG